MTTEERIKLAKEALESGSYDRETIEYIFPELKESEGEKIRKWLKGVLATYEHDFDLRDKALAWLEKQGGKDILEDAVVDSNEDGLIADTIKQGEQKPVNRLKTIAGNWYVCEMEVMNENMTTAFHSGEVYYCPKDGYIDVNGALFEVGTLDVFRLATKKEIPQPKQEWSEEDENRFKNLYDVIDDSKWNEASKNGFKNWLKLKLKAL